MSGMGRHALAFALSLWTARASAAEPTTLVLDGVLGPAYLIESRSHAPSHLFKPILRLDLRAELAPRLEVGGGAIALLDSSEHYRVLGGGGRARIAVLQTARFSLGGAAALGAGYGADIFEADLSTERTIEPYWVVSLDGRWAVAGRWLVGVEAGWHNAALLYLGAVVGARLGGGAR